MQPVSARHVDPQIPTGKQAAVDAEKNSWGYPPSAVHPADCHTHLVHTPIHGCLHWASALSSRKLGNSWLENTFLHKYHVKFIFPFPFPVPHVSLPLRDAIRDLPYIMFARSSVKIGDRKDWSVTPRAAASGANSRKTRSQATSCLGANRCQLYRIISTTPSYINDTCMLGWSHSDSDNSSINFLLWPLLFLFLFLAGITRYCGGPKGSPRRHRQ